MAVKKPFPRAPAILKDHRKCATRLRTGTNIASSQSGDMFAARNNGIYCKTGKQISKPAGLPAFWQIIEPQKQKSRYNAANIPSAA